MITKDTSLVGIFGGTEYDLYKLYITYGPPDVDKERVKRLAPLFIKWGKKFTIRADLAWCQTVHETDWLRFSGIAKKEWNNFAGIGVTGPPGVGNRFKTEELGVIAQFAHLAWYVTPVHVNSYCNQKYDPRHFGSSHRYNGNTTIDRLAGHWAVPGKYKQPDGTWITYGGQIARIANKIFPSAEQENESKPLHWLKKHLKIPTIYDWQYLAIHHTVSGQFWTTMKKIKQWHLARGFLREGYHFGIDGYGKTEKGRPLTMHGAHVKGFNKVALGIAIYGDFRTGIITTRQKNAVFGLCADLQKEKGIPTSKFLGHKEFKNQATSCPVIDMDWFRAEYINWLQKQ